jgi:hypothetical protein
MDMRSRKLSDKKIHSDSDRNCAKMLRGEKSKECETVNSIDQKINDLFEMSMVQSMDDAVGVRENLSSLSSISASSDNSSCKELQASMFCSTSIAEVTISNYV